MKRQQKKLVALDSDLLEWFYQEFPDGSLWWTINGLLRSFKEAVEDNTPKSYLERGASLFAETEDII